LDLIQFDVGVFRPRDGGAGNPPVGARQSGGQIGSGSQLSMLLSAAGTRNDFAVCGLPEPDKAALFADHDGVIPPPDHCLSAIFRRRDGY
jgi:hypothetical protein